jgi:hypothetical protein
MRPAFADAAAVLEVIDRLTPTHRAHHFSSLIPLSSAMSNAWSATHRLSRAFACSNSLSRPRKLAATDIASGASVLIPPAIQCRFADLQPLADLTDRRPPRASIPSASRSLAMTCSAVWRLRFLTSDIQNLLANRAGEDPHNIGIRIRGAGQRDKGDGYEGRVEFSRHDAKTPRTTVSSVHSNMKRGCETDTASRLFALEACVLATKTLFLGA